MLETNFPNLDEIFFTDPQLCERWNCTSMDLWRKRKAGVLKRPMKLPGSRINRTPFSYIKQVEEEAFAKAEERAA
jgi:hypothetical protein